MAEAGRSAKIFIFAVACATLLALVLLRFVYVQPIQPFAIIVLTVLAWLGEAARVPFARRGEFISFGSIVTLAAVPIVGIWGAVVVGACMGAAWLGKWPLKVRAFNAGQFGLMALAAGVFYALAGGTFGLTTRTPSLDFITHGLIPLVIANVAQCLTNGSLVAGIVSFSDGLRFRTVFLGMLRTGALPYIGYGLFGVLLVVLWTGAGIGALSAILVLAPLFIARWAWAQYADEQEAYERTVRALVRAVETKDFYTRGHSERVSAACVIIARQLALSEERTEALRFAGILHDLGKLGVPTRVLQKTGKLTDEEFAAITLHPVRGLEMVRDIEFLGEALRGILHHHERLDGRGYPMGLSGNEIPEFARMIAVADAFDSMTSTRSYREARSVEDSIAELRRCSGTQFEPAYVDALVAGLQLTPWQPADPPMPDALSPADGSGHVSERDHDDPTSGLSGNGADATGGRR